MHLQPYNPKVKIKLNQSLFFLHIKNIYYFIIFVFVSNISIYLPTAIFFVFLVMWVNSVTRQITVSLKVCVIYMWYDLQHIWIYDNYPLYIHIDWWIYIYIYTYTYTYVLNFSWTITPKHIAYSYVRNSQQWRHNGRDIVSNHQPHHCLLNRLFRGRSKKTSKLRVTGLCAGNSPGTGEFPAQMGSKAEMFPFDDVIMRVCWLR